MSPPPHWGMIVIAAACTFVAFQSLCFASRADPSTGFDAQISGLTLHAVSLLAAGAAASASGALTRRGALAASAATSVALAWSVAPPAPGPRDLSVHYTRILAVLLTLAAIAAAAGIVGAWKAVRVCVFRGWPRWCAAAALAAVFVLCPGALFAAVLSRARWRYARGLHGVSVDGGGAPARSEPGRAAECRMAPVRWPWMGMVPSRAFNFWMGSMQCPIARDAIARADERTGAITFLGPCRAARGGDGALDPHVVFSPDWVSWRVGKRRAETASFLLRPELRVTDVVVPWRGEAIPMPDGDEFAVARCGDREVMLVRNRRRDEAHARARAERDALLASGAPLPPNALFLLIDAVSRAQFHRRLPLVRAWLEAMADPADPDAPYSAYEFIRYNAMGSNTYPNIVPMCTGKYAFALEQERAHFGTSGARHLVWRAHYTSARRGYVAAYGMDLCHDYLGDYWSVDPRGGAGSPDADGLDHRFDYAFCNPIYEPPVRTNYRGPSSLGPTCIGESGPSHGLLLAHLKEFLDNYHDVGRVAFYQFQGAHEGSMEMAASLDSPLRDFLQWMHERGHLADTVTTLGSDHGNHMSPYNRFSVGGQIEQRLPLLTMIVPKVLERQHPWIPRNLRANARRLVSAFDIHKTLAHISVLPEKSAPRAGETELRGYSFFEPIPEGRSCGEAGIQPRWCACHLPGQQPHRDLRGAL